MKKQKTNQELSTDSVVAEQKGSYYAIIKGQFLKKRSGVWALRVISILFIIALFADFIANEMPIYCKIDGVNYWPIFRAYLVDLGWGKWPEELLNVDWQNLNYESVWRALIPYSSETLDMANASYQSPFGDQQVPGMRYWHWLGTDSLGRDVAAGMVHGTRISMYIGILAMLVATVIGVILGALAGYLGDDKFKLSRGRFLLNLIGLPLAFFYAFGARSYALSEGDFFLGQLMISILWFVGVLLIANLIGLLVQKIPFMHKQVSVAVDILVMRFIEVLNAIPNLLLLLAMLVIIRQPNIWNVMVIIGLISWTGIARFVRAELLKIRSLEYVEAARALGYSRLRIILRHALPNALTPVLITIAFGIAAAILVEAFLSFLGLGVGLEEVTWGKLLSLARRNFSAWWLALFPGLAIFTTVLCFNLVGEALTDAMDPKLKQKV